MRNGAEQALTDGPGIGQEYCWILAELQDVNLAGKKVVTRVQTPSFPKRRDGVFLREQRGKRRACTGV